MGGCSLALTMILYLTESLYFRSSTLTFYVIFPCVLNCKFIIFPLLRAHTLSAQQFRTIAPANSRECVCAVQVLPIFIFTLWWHCIFHNFYDLISRLFSAITLIGLIYIPKRLRLWDPHIDNDDENSQLLRQMGGFKKRRAPKKMPWSPTTVNSFAYPLSPSHGHRQFDAIACASRTM